MCGERKIPDHLDHINTNDASLLSTDNTLDLTKVEGNPGKEASSSETSLIVRSPAVEHSDFCKLARSIGSSMQGPMRDGRTPLLARINVRGEISARMGLKTRIKACNPTVAKQIVSTPSPRHKALRSVTER